MFVTLGDTSTSLIVVAIICIVIYLLVGRPGKPNGDRRLPPALPSLPVVGSLPFLFRHRHVPGYFMTTSKRLGDVFSLNAGSRYVVVLNGLSVVREALTNQGTDFADRCDLFSEFVHEMPQKGIILRPYDEKYKENRKNTLSILKEFGYGKRLMETKIREQVTELLQQIREMRGKPFYPHGIIMSSVGNLVLNILYGRRFDVNDPKLKQYMTDIEMMTNGSRVEVDIFPVLKYFPFYRRLSRVTRQHQQSAYDFGVSRLTEYFQDSCKPECFVDKFVNIQGVQNFDRKELLFILRDLGATALDTSTTTILWSLVLLANHRSVQDRLHAEIDAVIGRDRRPTLDDRKRLPYVEATLIEIMRFRTLIPLSVPHCTLRDTEVNGYFIPARAMVIVNLYSVHHDPDTWQDPGQFRPERFLDDSGNLSTLKNLVIPFSIGKRSCLGKQLARQEVFLFITGILQEFDICPPEGQDRFDETEKFGVIVQPLPFKVRLVPRRDS